MRRIVLAVIVFALIPCALIAVGILSRATALSVVPADSQGASSTAPADETDQAMNGEFLGADGPDKEEHPIGSFLLDILFFVIVFAGGSWYVAVSSKSD